MAMIPRLELRQTQRLALTPALRTGLSVLRMTSLDLAEEISREAARNPFLMVEAARRVGHLSTTSGAQARDLALSLTAEGAGFQEDLRRQVRRKPLDAVLAAAVDVLIGELRDDGFLDAGIDDLSHELSVPVTVLDRALEVLQSCEPAGVGARDLPECLCLQLVDAGLSAEDAAATVRHLPAFAARDWPRLATALSLTPEALHARAALLRTLTPRPIAERPPAAQVALRADFRLDRAADGTLSLVIDHAARPQVWLDDKMVQRAEADGFAPELLTRARTLIDAINQRGQTLQRIGDWLIEHQPGFFHQGPAGLKPGSRSALAAELGLHPSTVSRAVAGKALDIDGRLWPLSVFFSAGVAANGGEVSSRAVQHRMSQLIALEPDGKPLSDETLVNKLRAEGIDIARRTVAKYRQGLRIPSSSARRKLAAARQRSDRRTTRWE